MQRIVHLRVETYLITKLLILRRRIHKHRINKSHALLRISDHWTFQWRLGQYIWCRAAFQVLQFSTPAALPDWTIIWPRRNICISASHRLCFPIMSPQPGLPRQNRASEAFSALRLKNAAHTQRHVHHPNNYTMCKRSTGRHMLLITT